MKKVLVLSPTSGSAGVDICLLHFVKELNKKLDITVILPPGAFLIEKFREYNVNVYELPLEWWFYPSVSMAEIKNKLYRRNEVIHRIVDIIKYEKIDYVLSNTTTSWDGFFASSLCGIPHFFWMHAKYVDNIYTNLSLEEKKALYKIMSIGSEKIICCSSTLARQMEEIIDNVAYVQNGIDLDEYVENYDIGKNDTFNILTLGHYNANKNIELMLRAILLIREKAPNVYNNIRYCCYGPAEADYYRELKSFVEKNGLVDKVFLNEYLETPSIVLKEADLYANISITETLPLSVMEAMATGLPCIVTPTDGGKIIVEDNVSGFICDTENIIAEKIIELFNDREKLKIMGMNARRRVEEFFSLKNYNDFIQFFSGENHNTMMLADMIKILCDRTSNMKVRVLVIYPEAAQATFAIAAELPLELLKKDGKVVPKYTGLANVSEKDIYESDVVFCVRYYHEEVQSLIDVAHKFGKKWIWYIDDNYDAIKFSGDGIIDHVSVKNDLYERMFSKADCTIVNNRTIYELGRKITPNIRLLPTYQILDSNFNSDNEKGCITFGFMGTLGRDGDFTNVTRAIVKIIEKYGDKIKVEFIGYIPKELDSYSNVEHFEFINDYMSFRKFFVSRHWDFALAPLKDSEFNNSKTNNKYREYSSMRIPAIYSDISTYNKCVEDHYNGLLVRDTVDEWFDAMDELVLNSKLRIQLAEKAYEDIQKNYSIYSYADRLLDAIYENCASKTSEKYLADEEVLNENRRWLIHDKHIADNMYFTGGIHRKRYSEYIYVDELKYIKMCFAKTVDGPVSGIVDIIIKDDRRNTITDFRENLENIEWNMWTRIPCNTFFNMRNRKIYVDIRFKYKKDSVKVGVWEYRNKKKLFSKIHKGHLYLDY
ncbi:Glycosyltransferase involved in cell wall bisynthesis [Butyrivibrio hungatei]|uniref:Glycosyltransferase involved in cell wall bisynthesis n=1 Tax=Butyrivibrio hungatei TaxID=185008 RepID=A0A1G5G7C7_9FIRM|nr:glycosyltransferase [Butyrivibrio hungatei]SCY46638.1 Glycosyltransferase involved in cell wall bisynthesis [Butyrivibrio hungatei]